MENLFVLKALRQSISTVAEKLMPYGFIRIHGSELVNTWFMVEIKPYSAGKYGLRVKGGKKFAVTRVTKRISNVLQNSGSVAGRSLPNSLP